MKEVEHLVIKLDGQPIDPKHVGTLALEFTEKNPKLFRNVNFMVVLSLAAILSVAFVASVRYTQSAH